MKRSGKGVKTLFLLLGTMSLALGVLGIVVPGLPATPFFLLTAALYLRSSERLYRKLLNNRLIGEYIREYRLHRGMTMKAKTGAIVLMWTMIAVSCLFLIRSRALIAVVVLAGISGTVVMGFMVPTVKIPEDKNP